MTKAVTAEALKQEADKAYAELLEFEPDPKVRYRLINKLIESEDGQGSSEALKASETLGNSDSQANPRAEHRPELPGIRPSSFRDDWPYNRRAWALLSAHYRWGRKHSDLMFPFIQ